jgi:hypothetical protein
MMEMTVPEIVHAFFANRLGLHNSADFRGVLWAPDRLDESPVEYDEIAVAVGYNSFIGRTCCMHTVVQRPDLLNRRMVIAAFSYPFNVCGCEAVLALVDSTNEAALSFDTRLGFKEIARVPNGGGDADLIVLQMLRADCRWLRLH